jgi:hypothetical protein
LPGVTVEAASPVLIEGPHIRHRQRAVTGSPAPPGVYSITFTLPGFRNARHEGIELTTGFVATRTEN